jgi:hypothetical protein
MIRTAMQLGDALASSSGNGLRAGARFHCRLRFSGNVGLAEIVQSLSAGVDLACRPTARTRTAPSGSVP